MESARKQPQKDTRVKASNRILGSQGAFEHALCEEIRLSPFAEDLRSVCDGIDLLHYGGKRLKGIPTGFKELDDKLAGLHKSDLIVIGARPSCGKTALLLDIARHAARHGYKVGMFSSDLDKEQVITRVISADTGIPLWGLITGRLDPKQHARFTRSYKEIGKMTLFLDDTPRLTVSEMRARTLRLRQERGLDILVVDSVQLIQPSSILGDDPVKHMTEVARGLKLIAQELEVPVVVTAPLIRQPCGEYRIPRLSNLCELERSADIILFIYAGDWEKTERRGMQEYRVMQLLIAKNKGRIGEIDLWFNPELVSFVEAK